VFKGLISFSLAFLPFIVVTVLVKFTLEKATKGQKRSRGKVLPFFNHGAAGGWVFNATAQRLYLRE